MKNVKVKEFYSLSSLNKDENWGKILEVVRERGYDKDEEGVELDFSGIRVESPTRRESFKELLKCNHIGIKLYNSEKIVGSIKAMCILENTDPDRITNVDSLVKRGIGKEAVKKDEKRDAVSKSIYLSKDGATLEFIAKEQFNQIETRKTIDAIREAIKMRLKSDDCGDVDTIIVDLKGIRVAESSINAFVEMKVSLEAETSIDVCFDIEGEKEIELMEMHIHDKTSAKLSQSEKYEVIKGIGVGTVGILIKYKEGRATDEFGRQGKGRVISGRIAIFRGVTIQNDGDRKVVLKFDTFNGDEFYTRQHTYILEDGYSPEELKVDTVYVDLNDIGISNKFLGSRYHFNRPIQRDKSETIQMYALENNKSVSKEVTIPERAMYVLDDFGIEYNRGKLMSAIEVTKKALSEE